LKEDFESSHLGVALGDIVLGVDSFVFSESVRPILLHVAANKAKGEVLLSTVCKRNFTSHEYHQIMVLHVKEVGSLNWNVLIIQVRHTGEVFVNMRYFRKNLSIFIGKNRPNHIRVTDNFCVKFNHSITF